MSSNPAIFISHSHEDKDVAEFFVELLQEMGVLLEEIYCSSNPETGSPAGAGLTEELKNKITSSEVIVAIITRAYQDSLFCMSEYGAAWGLDKKIIPLCITYESLRRFVIMDNCILTSLLDVKNVMEVVKQIVTRLRSTCSVDESRVEELVELFCRNIRNGSSLLREKAVEAAESARTILGICGASPKTRHHILLPYTNQNKQARMMRDLDAIALGHILSLYHRAMCDVDFSPCEAVGSLDNLTSALCIASGLSNQLTDRLFPIFFPGLDIVDTRSRSERVTPHVNDILYATTQDDKFQCTTGIDSAFIAKFENPKSKGDSIPSDLTWVKGLESILFVFGLTAHGTAAAAIYLSNHFSRFCEVHKSRSFCYAVSFKRDPKWPPLNIFFEGDKDITDQSIRPRVIGADANISDRHGLA